MNIQEACAKRINERRVEQRSRQRAADLERSARLVRESFAAGLIQSWISRIYSLDLDLTQLVVSENSHQENGGTYHLNIKFEAGYIEANRHFEVRDGKAWPEPRNFDAPERGQFAELWKVVRENYGIKLDDLIDAVVYATDAENTLPDISDEEIDAMFPKTVEA